MGEEIQFGEELTYPTLVCGPDDTLYLTARRSQKNQPWSVEQWTKRVGEDWQGPLGILRSSSDGYSHFQEALAWSPDHRSLHLPAGCTQTEALATPLPTCAATTSAKPGIAVTDQS